MALPGWWTRVKPIMDGVGIPVSVWLPILWAESGGDPNAHNTHPPDDSVGLFQLNRNGGQGANYSVAQLQDPVLNASITANHFAVANAICARKGQKNDLTCISIYSGHPTETGVITEQIKPTIAKIQAAGKALGEPKDDQEAWSNVSKTQAPAPGEPVQVTPPASTWDDIVGQINDAIKGTVSSTGAAVDAGTEKTVWSAIFFFGGLGCLWLGLSGLVAPAVKVAANTVGTVVPQARAVGAAAGAVAGTTNAIGKGVASVGKTTVGAIDAIAPKHGGRQAIRIKGRPGLLSRSRIPPPPLHQP